MRTLLFSSLVLVPFLAACGSPCSKTVDKMVECKQIPAEAAAKATEECEADAKDPAKAALTEKAAACGEKDCDAAVECLAAVSVEEDIQKATASGNWGMAGYQCKDVKGDELKAACGKLFDTAIPAMTAEMTKERDTGEKGKNSCLDLSMLAKTKGGDAQTAADTLCAEVDAAEYVRKCEAAAAENATAKKADMPFDCNMADTYLQKVTSDWGKTRGAEMDKTLVTGLGKVILAEKVPGMQYVCDTNVQSIYDRAKKGGITDPEIDPLLAKADALCAPKAN